MIFQATLTSMVDPLSPIYSELWWFQITEFAPFFSGYPEISEFGTVITQSISDLERQPWKSKLFRMSFPVR